MTKSERLQKTNDNKMFRKGQKQAIQFMINLMAWVLVEHFKMDSEFVQSVMDSLKDYSDDLMKGNINYQDIVQALKDEHDITVVWQ